MLHDCSHVAWEEELSLKLFMFIVVCYRKPQDSDCDDHASPSMLGTARKR